MTDKPRYSTFELITWIVCLSILFGVFLWSVSAFDKCRDAGFSVGYCVRSLL